MHRIKNYTKWNYMPNYETDTAYVHYNYLIYKF